MDITDSPLSCICSKLRQLVRDDDDSPANAKSLAATLAPELNAFLGDLRTLLSRSKSLSRHVDYQIIPCNQRTMKALVVESVNLAPVDTMCTRFRDDAASFWSISGEKSGEKDGVHSGLHRRLLCTVVFLRSKLNVLDSASIPPQKNCTELRNAGRKYIKIARKLGSLGALFWLPLDIPHSTYERYLNMDDEPVFDHLKMLAPPENDQHRYSDIVRQLLLSQFLDLPPSCSHHNLFPHYSDVVPASDQLLLLLYALGGSDIPLILFTSIRSPQRRWSEHGEMATTSAAEYGLPPELIRLCGDDDEVNLKQALTESPHITQHTNNDGIALLSLSPEMQAFFSTSLLPVTVATLDDTALKLICFACPPCYEGNTVWSASAKRVIWPLLDAKTARPDLIQEPLLRTQSVEAVLYFCERDGVALRRVALIRARSLLKRSMPYYIHASVVLFQSILHRLDGELATSQSLLQEFAPRGKYSAGSPRSQSAQNASQKKIAALTRRDLAIQGRLHISHIDNKIRAYDMDVSLQMYKWEAAQPLSMLDIQVTSRLQGVAARFFQSVGDFPAAAASLDQYLSLLSSMDASSSANTRRLIVGRLADLYCELGDPLRAASILQPELDNTGPEEQPRRPYRRLLLSLIEVHISLERFDEAEQVLQQLKQLQATSLPPPLQLDNIHDQQLYVRGLLASARIAHSRPDPDLDEAIRRWQHVLQEIRHMHTLNTLQSQAQTQSIQTQSQSQSPEGKTPDGRSPDGKSPADQAGTNFSGSFTEHFTEAIIHLSLAHAQMAIGDSDGTRHSWTVGMEILRREKCEFWIPIVPTLWLKKIVMQVHEQLGWSFRMMLPGGKPDMTWPF